MTEQPRRAITLDSGAILVWTAGRSVAIAVDSHSRDWTAKLDVGQAVELRDALQECIEAALVEADGADARPSGR
jgi:hypothetical protein